MRADTTPTEGDGMNAAALREAIEHAPQSCGPIAEHLRGWWTPSGCYVCARCAGRLAGRGVALPRGSNPVWDDHAEPYGVCVCCDEGNQYAHA